MESKSSLVYGVKLTKNSKLCKRHFIAADTNENPFETNCSSKELKPYKNTFKRSKTYSDGDYLTRKKTKKNFPSK